MIPAEALKAALNAEVPELGGPVSVFVSEYILRMALEAAAPHMLAAAWDAGAAYMSDGWSAEQDPAFLPNPYRSGS